MNSLLESCRMPKLTDLAFLFPISTSFQMFKANICPIKWLRLAEIFSFNFEQRQRRNDKWEFLI